LLHRRWLRATGARGLLRQGCAKWDRSGDACRHERSVPSNPVYGLNATGGALAFEMKNGYTYHAVEGEVNGGSYGRAVASVQAGGEVGNLSGYITADAIDDAGWRMDTPSSLRRVFADFGARGVPASGPLGTSFLAEIDRTFTTTNSFGGSVQASSAEKVF